MSKPEGPVVMRNGVRVGGYDPSEIPVEQHGNYLLHEGRLYELRKIGTESIPEIKKHLLSKRGSVLEQVAKQLESADISALMQAAMVKEAIRAATSSQVTQAELSEFMTSPDGVAFVMWLSLKDSMDGLSLEKAERLFYEVTEQEAKRRAEMEKAAAELSKDKSPENSQEKPTAE